MKKLLAIVLVLCMVVAVAACGSKDAATGSDNKSDAAGQTLKEKAANFDRKNQFLTVGTGPTSGIYFPIGGAFATALKDYGYQTSAEATNATGQNIQNILNKDCEIAIAMQDAVMQAYTATGAYEGKEPASDLRALMRLWPNYVQLVTTANTGITSVEDLKGKVTANTISSTYAATAEGYGATVTGVDALADTIQLVLQGRVDATLNAEVAINDYLREHADAKIKVVAQIEGDRCCIPVRNAPETETLVAAIDEALETLRANGRLAEISKKYFNGLDLTDISGEAE